MRDNTNPRAGGIRRAVPMTPLRLGVMHAAEGRPILTRDEFCALLIDFPFATADDWENYRTGAAEQAARMKDAEDERTFDRWNEKRGE